MVRRRDEGYVSQSILLDFSRLVAHEQQWQYLLGGTKHHLVTDHTSSLRSPTVVHALEQALGIGLVRQGRSCLSLAKTLCFVCRCPKMALPLPAVQHSIVWQVFKERFRTEPSHARLVHDVIETILWLPTEAEGRESNQYQPCSLAVFHLSAISVCRLNDWRAVHSDAAACAILGTEKFRRTFYPVSRQKEAPPDNALKSVAARRSMEHQARALDSPAICG
mmetsp:Transcript_72872/g.236769  ORF Transcript_72872/g.236769 Transcript_72872/m.236769 type:complete len:221 (-) Transcript_72872:977-1639(-)